MTQREIDVVVSDRLRRGLSLYQVDEGRLQELTPDLILTQDLCQVCAPSGNEIAQVLKALPQKPEILWLTPKTIGGIFDNLKELGAATGRELEAEALIADARAKLANIAGITRDLEYRPRVFCMEWVDPPYCSGHWVPEMVELAGGIDALGRRGTDSARVPWSEILAWAPEIFLVMPCGCDLKRAVKEAGNLTVLEGWAELPAVRSGHVYALDANSYFARPGPRVVDGAELLAHLLHPGLFGWNGPQAFQRLAP